MSAAAAARALPADPGPARLPLQAYLEHGSAAGLRWTALRVALLRLIWNARRPLGAYEAAARLRHGGRTTAPVTVYRCLRGFQEAGLIVSLVKWKRYALSPDPANRLWGALLCRSCRACTLVDLAGARPALERRLAARAFTAASYTIECEGRCGACAGAGAGAGP